MPSMPFLWTLQRYIFREMGRTFLLTALALTGVLGLGGGVLNMIKLGEVTPSQLLRLMALVLPVAAALTLPVAALFSAASTYGRLSADNEFVACRASGINLYWLFLPTIVLSVLSASITFAFINFVIPGMVRNLNEMVGADVGTMIQQRLNRPRGITLGGRFRIQADHCLVDSAHPDRVVLQNVTFVEVSDQEWVRFGTAQEVHLQFDRSASHVRVAGTFFGLSYYDREDNEFFEESEMVVPTNVLPSLVPAEIKFQTVGELFYYLSRPGEWEEVRQAVEQLRRAVGRWKVYQALWDDWRADQALTLRDADLVFEVRSRLGALAPRESGLALTDVTIEERRGGEGRTYRADRANIELARGGALTESGIQIEAYDVQVTTRSGVFEQARKTLGPVAIPVPLLQEIEAMSVKDLFAIGRAGDPGDPRRVKHAEALAERSETIRRIVGTINERMAFSVSVFVLVILGAALGIIFRGSHVVTAFGISFVPLLFVTISIVMGKQMANNATTHLLGLAVMWGGIVLVAALDVWTLGRVLRR